MFKIIIFNPDQSVYWEDNFNSLSELNRWLETEKTREYWNKLFTYQVIDNSPKPEEIEQQNIKEQERKEEIKLRIKAIKGVKNAKTVNELKIAVMELVKHLGIDIED